MPKPTLAQRVAELERQMNELHNGGLSDSRSKDWRRTIGMFDGDEVMKRILDAALTYRERNRQKARRRTKL
jgi:cell division protein FtsB